ncbi:MAG: glycosyltransferase [Verrucomicrobiota bacterium]
MKSLSEPACYPLLPATAGIQPLRPLRICIASFDFVGPVRNGGVGTAFTSLGEAMAAAGHEVTLLFLGGTWCENRTMVYWIEYYKKKGIQFVPLPESGLRIETRWPVAKGYEGYLWLQKQSFDVIHFSEWKGPGFFTLVAKQQGSAFANTLLCVHTHGPTLWHKLSNAEYVTHIDDLEVDYIERRSVEMADVVVSPSQYLLRWMLDRDWVLPKQCFVRQYVRPATARKPLANAERVHRVSELVFFGRLEVRKGLVLFCDALEHLKDEPKLRHAKITFLGKVDKICGRDSADYLADRFKQWPWKWQIIKDRDQAGAMDYLEGRERLAVLPSLVDNLPNTVLECLGARIPFLASNAGGIPEMIAASDLEATCFPLRAKALADKLRHALTTGVRPAGSAVEAQENERAWVRWHESLPLANSNLPTVAAVALPGTQPLVSICMSHWNRPAYLQQAMASIEAQDYPHFEVVLVDDGSTDSKARKLIDSLETQFAERGWQLLRNAENRYPGAARNLAARHARGEFILFMDDDNCAKPHEVSTFVRIAQKTGADILSCCLDTFSGQDAPHAQLQPKTRWLFLGDDAATGALRNGFGDTNSLWRREAFLALGGFHEDWGVGYEDWELFARAVLKGYKLQVVPEPLAWYRLNEFEQTVNRKTPLHANHMASIRPYLEAVPPSLRHLIHLAQGQLMASLEAGQRLRALEEEANRNSTDTPYAQATIQWRSSLVAGRHLLARHLPEAARELLLEAVKAAEHSKDSQVILEALLEIVPDLGRLDPGRAKYLGEMTVKLAGSLRKPTEQQRARQLLAAIPVSRAGDLPPVAHSPQSVAASDSVRPRFEAINSAPFASQAPVLLHGVLALAVDNLNGGQAADALETLNRLAPELSVALRLHYGRSLALAKLGRFAEATEALDHLPEADRNLGRIGQFSRELRQQVSTTLLRP